MAAKRPIAPPLQQNAVGDLIDAVSEKDLAALHRKQEEEAEQRGIVEEIAELLLDAYKAGEIALHDLLRYAVPLADTLPAPIERDRTLAEVMRKAGKVPRKPVRPGRKAVPKAMREHIRKLVQLVNRHEELPVNAAAIDSADGQSAFARAVEIIHERTGWDIKPTQIARWYQGR